MTVHDKASNAVIEEILADIAIGVQLTSTEDRKARDRYEALRNWIERPSSPLCGRVEEFYPQGSMAIGATIRAVRSDEEYDVDIVVQVRYDKNMSPQERLDELCAAVRGDKESRYYDMTTKQSRCVTITYRDGMHLDMVPAWRDLTREEKVSFLPHAPGGTRSRENCNYVGNSYGFAEWFKRQAGEAGPYGQQFAKRAWEYELRKVQADADVQEVPEQTSPQEKGLTVIGLQLFKRFRNEAYKKTDAKPPPSVILTKFAGDGSGQTTTLLDELSQQTDMMTKKLGECLRSDTILHVPNPICSDDILTDRWPQDRKNQEMLHRKLAHLKAGMECLKSGNLSLAEIKEVCAGIFGMEISRIVVERYADRLSSATKSHKASIGPRGRLFPAIAVGGTPVPKHTFYGD